MGTGPRVRATKCRSHRGHEHEKPPQTRRFLSWARRVSNLRPLACEEVDGIEGWAVARAGKRVLRSAGQPGYGPIRADMGRYRHKSPFVPISATPALPPDSM